MRRVHHASAADVQADMTESGEHEHVARLHPPPWDAPTLAIEGVGGPWDLDAEPAVSPVDEAGAVEPARGGGASPSVLNADRPERVSRDTLAEGSLGSRPGRRYRLGPEPVRQRRWLRLLGCARSAGMEPGVRLSRRAREDARGKGERKQSSAEWVRHRERNERPPNTFGGIRGLLVPSTAAEHYLS